MRRLVKLHLAVLTALIAACVTINVYFPAAAAEKAADKILNEVLPESKPKADDQTSMRFEFEPGRWLVASAAAVSDFFLPAAEAQQPDLDVSSPEIRAITDSMKARNATLKKYYDSGAVGSTADGLIDVRDQNLVPLPERTEVRKLVADENKDRSALYAEIAKHNGHPEWEGDIRKTFGDRLAARAKQSGWYHRDSSGSWSK